MSLIAQKLNPETAIKVDSASFDFLANVAANRASAGRVGIVAVGNTVLMAVAATKGSHAEMIDRATMSTFKCSYLDRSEFLSPRAQDGVVIEGAYFELREGQVEIFGKSSDFGGFRSQIFDQPTEAVLSRVLSDIISDAYRAQLEVSSKCDDFAEVRLPARE